MKTLLLLLLALMIVIPAAGLADDADIWNLPNKSTELNEDFTGKINVTKVAQITGENSENKTLSRFGVWGTDLGSMTELNGKVYLFGGDTFSSEDGNDWRSNVLFVIEDDDPSDGLTITDAVVDESGMAKEEISSLKSDGVQVTAIPTDIFTVGDNLYCIYMSVKHWNELGGSWICGFSRLVKSENEGQKWKNTDVRWPGESNFIQTAHCIVGDTIYFWGIPAGRYGGVALMKVKTDELEDQEAYEYFIGTDDNNNPQWIKGSDGISQAKQILPPNVGELSVIYNEYLGNFVMTYLVEGGKGIVMREGVTPWGDWSNEYVLASPTKYASLYGAFMCPKYVENNGQTFYFAMSQYFPIYNIMWMKAELP